MAVKDVVSEAAEDSQHGSQWRIRKYSKDIVSEVAEGSQQGTEKVGNEVVSWAGNEVVKANQGSQWCIQK